jgi:hypothetical protein
MNPSKCAILTSFLFWGLVSFSLKSQGHAEGEGACHDDARASRVKGRLRILGGYCSPTQMTHLALNQSSPRLRWHDDRRVLLTTRPRTAP